jgi:anthranilate synthase component I
MPKLFIPYYKGCFGSPFFFELTMQKQALYLFKKTFLADTLTPVSAFLRIRDIYPGSTLYESNDFHFTDRCYSYLNFNPIKTIKADQSHFYVTENGKTLPVEIEENSNQQFKSLLYSLEVKNSNFPLAAWFGYFSTSAYPIFKPFEHNQLDPSPIMQFSFYKFIIAFNHFNNTITIYNFLEEDAPEKAMKEIEEVNYTINHKDFSLFEFNTNTSDLQFPEQEIDTILSIADEDFIKYGLMEFKEYISQSIGYKGDDFNVYRSLRSIAPSPFLFYLDFLNQKLIGSGENAHIEIYNEELIYNHTQVLNRKHGNDDKEFRDAELLAEGILSEIDKDWYITLSKNSLEEFCDPKSIKMQHQIQSFSKSNLLVSTLKGKIQRNNFSAIDTLGINPHVIGLPYKKAIERQLNNKNSISKVFSGSVGYITLSGNMLFSSLNKSFLVKNNKIHFGLEVHKSQNPYANDHMENIKDNFQIPLNIIYSATHH